MVTYGVLIWSIIASGLIGGTVGMLVMALMNVAKDRIEVRKEDKSDEREKM